jgi:hypothetical protein
MVWNRRSTPYSSFGGKNSKENAGEAPKRSTIFMRFDS